MVLGRYYYDFRVPPYRVHLNHYIVLPDRLQRRVGSYYDIQCDSKKHTHHHLSFTYTIN